jgi:Zn-dependent protease with chaperone function
MFDLNISDSNINWLKEKGRVIMTFKLRIAAVMGTFILGSIPNFLIFNQPYLVRLIYARAHVPKKVKVFLTESKFVTGPYCNMLSGNVYLPKSWLSKYHESEINAAIAHEFGHSTRRNRFNLTNIILFTVLTLYSVYVVAYTMPGIGQMAAIAFEMLVLTWIARNNEYRADWDGAQAAGPEGLISLFEWWIEEGGNEGSETHPSPKARIERLLKLLD